MRQTEGFFTSIFGMLGIDLTAPDHTTLSRRGQHLALALRRARPGTCLHLWVANYYSARNPLRLSSLVILGVVARMFRCATRSSCWCT